MKIIRKTKPVRGKRAIEKASSKSNRARTVGKALRETFKQPFHVEYRDRETYIEWECGPRREEVWDHLVCNFPELAAEQIAVGLMWNGYDIRAGEITLPIPFQLKRYDLFNVANEEILRLVEAGADLEESTTEYGTPLHAAVFMEEDERAVILAKAGASVERYCPSGDLWDYTRTLPSFLAYIEALVMEREANLAASTGRPSRRL